jgi:hypothetical protein
MCLDIAPLSLIGIGFARMTLIPHALSTVPGPGPGSEIDTYSQASVCLASGERDKEVGDLECHRKHAAANLALGQGGFQKEETSKAALQCEEEVTSALQVPHAPCAP